MKRRRGCLPRLVEITYWLDRKFWGQGIATKALNIFLDIETTRPIFGRVAFDNFGSQKVLEKRGFAKIGSNYGFANARQTEIEEFIYNLDKTHKKQKYEKSNCSYKHDT
jgi:[ribosomal protein S5]-alanine N-acetyltransferase